MVCQNCGLPQAQMASFCLKCGSPFLPSENSDFQDPTFYQVASISAGRRFWAFALDAVLFWLTLGFGWIIWMIILLQKGQTPAKQILDYVLVDHGTGKRPPTWRTALREFVPLSLAIFTFFGPLYVLTYTHEVAADLTIPIGGTLITAGFLVADALFVFAPQRRRLFDYIFNTSVVAGRNII